MLSALKNFGITFLISMAIFGVIAYFATGFVTGTVTDILENEQDELSEIIGNPDSDPDDTKETSEDPVEDPEEEIYGESFNFVIVTTDYRPDLYSNYLPDVQDIEIGDPNYVYPSDLMGYLSSEYRKQNVTSIVIVRIDKEREQVIYSYLTPKIRVFTSSGYRTLSEVYDIYGLEKLTALVNGLTGLDFDYTFLLNGYNMDEMVNVIGSIGISVDKNIYNDGMYNTFATHRTVETTDRDGDVTKKQVANTKVLDAGYIAYTPENFYNAVSVIEHSSSDLAAKQTLSIETVRSILTYLAGLDEDHVKTILAQLLIKEENWESIPDMIQEIKRSVKEEPTDPDVPALPFDTTPVETETLLPPEETEVPETEAIEGEVEGKETDEEDSKLFEPDTTILESNFTPYEFYEIYDLLRSVLQYEHKIITYPVTYVAETADSQEYFISEIQRGIDLFSEYRKTADPVK